MSYEWIFLVRGGLRLSRKRIHVTRVIAYQSDVDPQSLKSLLASISTYNP